MSIESTQQSKPDRLTLLCHEILRCWVVHNNRAGALLRFTEKSRSPPYANRFFGFEQRKKLGLLFEVRARRISERIARTAILLVEKVSDAFGVLLADAHLLANDFMHILGE